MFKNKKTLNNDSKTTRANQYHHHGPVLSCLSKQSKAKMTKSTTTNTSNVRVGVRIRPLTSSERSLGGNEVVRTNEPQKEVILGENKRKFTYDAVFDGHVQQEQLYNQVAPPLLKSFLDGYNATVSASNVFFLRYITKLICFECSALFTRTHTF